MIEFIQQRNYGPIELLMVLIGLGVTIVILTIIKDLLVAKFKGASWNGDERRKDMSLTLNEEVINRVLESFEKHTKIMQELVDTLKIVDEHILDNRKIVTAHYQNIRQDIQNMRR